MKSLLVLISLSITASIASAAPAAHTDSDHVANGCFISAAIYLRKVPGKVAKVTLPSGQQHSVAVISEGDAAYLRDEFIGVHRIIDGDVQRTYSRALKRWLKAATPEQIAQQANEGTPDKLEQRRTEVARAQRLLGEGEIVEVGQRVALVWAPRPGVLAAYEPEMGTLVAETKAPNAAAFARAALKAASIN
jgi:hypothetical protein